VTTHRTQTVSLVGRALTLELSAAAGAALARETSPRVAEMELYFSCLIRKRVRFPATPHPDALCVRVDDRLTVCFRPVMTSHCDLHAAGGKPPLEAFPIRKPAAFIPKRLVLDYRRESWSGEFSY
jgi:hypothetical protein